MMQQQMLQHRYRMMLQSGSGTRAGTMQQSRLRDGSGLGQGNRAAMGAGQGGGQGQGGRRAGTGRR
jgi:hypothetical protein